MATAATDILENLIVDLLDANDSALRIQSGTGTNAPAVTDTDLQTPTGSRVVGTDSQPSSNVYQVVGTLAYTSTLAITEVGLFQTGSVADCCMRATFSAINVVNGDSIQFTLQLTMAAQTA